MLTTIGLNPCFSGCWSRTENFTNPDARSYCLNPCFSGCWSRTLRTHCPALSPDCVLILVLVDVGLGPCTVRSKSRQICVLILVLVDVGLGLLPRS